MPSLGNYYESVKNVRKKSGLQSRASLYSIRKNYSILLLKPKRRPQRKRPEKVDKSKVRLQKLRRKKRIPVRMSAQDHRFDTLICPFIAGV